MEDRGSHEAVQAAFFDLDKTLMAGSSGMQFAKAARERGLISRAQVLRWGRDHVRYRIKGATDDETNEILKVARETLSGVSHKDIMRMWPEVLAGILPRIYPEVLAEVHRHQDEGRLTFIVSAAGSDLVERLATVLGMDGGIGTRYEVADGVYTGEIEGPFVYGRGKVIAIERLSEEGRFDLDGSWAYSDSISDLPMMDLVGNAVAVNPDAPLLDAARREGWKVMRFERLGRNLAIGGTAAVALVAGGIGGWLSRRRAG